jgi:hypothetical protein
LLSKKEGNGSGAKNKNNEQYKQKYFIEAQSIK